MLGYPTAKRSVTRLLLASLLIAILIIMAIPVTSNAVGESSDFYGFAVKYQDGPRKIELMWDKGNLQNGWAEGEWVPYQLVISNVDMADPSGYVVEYDVYNATKDAQFVDLVRGFQVKSTTNTLNPTETNLFRLQNSDQGWPGYEFTTGTFPDIPAYYAGIDAVEAAQNATMDIPAELGEGTAGDTTSITDGDLWPDFTWLDIPYDQINLGEPLTDTPDDKSDFSPLTSTDTIGYFIVTKDDLRGAGVEEDTTTIVLYFQFHLSRTSLWSSGLYHGYSDPNVPAYEWGGYVYGNDSGDPFYEVTRFGSKYYSEGSAGHAMLLGAAKTVPIPVPAQNLGSVEGYKRDAMTGLGLEGWPVYVSAEIDGMSFVLGTVTDDTGHYIFPTLTYGMRYITEGLTRINPDTDAEETWMQTAPDPGTGVFNVDDVFMEPDSYRDYFREIVTDGNLMYIPAGTEMLVPDFDPDSDLADDLAQFGYVIEIKARDYTFTEKNFENIFVGALKIDKDFFEAAIGDLPEALLPATVTVNVVGPSYPAPDGEDFILLKANDYDMTLEDLIPGQYCVTEISLSDHQTFWTLATTPICVNVEAGTTAETALTAQLNDNLIPGALKIDKDFLESAIGDLPEALKPASVTVKVTGPSYAPSGQTFDLLKAADYDMTLTNLIPGEYCVTEISLSDHVSFWTLQSTPVCVTVEPGTTAETALTAQLNDNLIPGALKIDKDFLESAIGDLPEALKPASVTVKVTGPSYAPSGQNFDLLKAADYDMTLTNLIPGEYCVTEISLSDHTSFWTIQSVPVCVTVDPGTTAETALTAQLNDNLIPGALTINKAFVGGTNYPSSIQVKVTGPSYDSSPDGFLIVTIPIDPMTGLGSETLNNLIPGLYNVTELTFDGSSMWSSVITGSPATVNPGESTPVVVTITNTYIPPEYETACAAHEPGVYRFTETGNWFTYIKYNELDDGKANIYAGKTTYVGYVEFEEVTDGVEITITLEDWAFAPGANVHIQNYNTEPIGTSAVPGSFDYHFSATTNPFVTTVIPSAPYYAVHIVVYED